MLMPLRRKRTRPHRSREESEQLRSELLKAAANLEVFVSALRAEIENEGNDGRERTTPQH